MTTLLRLAMAALSRLSPHEQDEIAILIHQELLKRQAADLIAVAA